MILKDIVEEYSFVYDTLLPCKPYFDTADQLITEYFAGVTGATSAYFKQPAINDSIKNTLVNSLNSAITKTYNNITILITESFEFHSALSLLDAHKFVNSELKKLVKVFISSSKDTINSTNTIIREQLGGMKTKELLPEFISHLQKTIKLYSALINLNTQFQHVETMLTEPIPVEVLNNDNYKEFDIQSLSPSCDLDQVQSSLSELSNLFENVGRLCEIKQERYYYLRKIETGSLLTSFLTAVPIIVATVKLIDYCYPKFIKWKQLHYASKAEPLKLANEELDTVKKLLEIQPDLPDADQLLETAAARVFRYFKLNPEFKVNDKTYKTTMDVKLLQMSSENNEEN